VERTAVSEGAARIAAVLQHISGDTGKEIDNGSGDASSKGNDSGNANSNVIGTLSGKAVFFGGAGVSTESGIPDFRSEKGLYSAQQVYGHRPEELLSYGMFIREPELFFRYYVENLIDLSAQPNAAHLAVAELEKRGIITAVVTQNIDGLHQMAGSQNVIELHGSNWRPYCVNCQRRYSLEWLLAKSNWRAGSGADRAVVPRCEMDDGIVRSDVVLYGENLSDTALNEAAAVISGAETLIVAGTSLAVYPAAGLVRLFGGDSLIVINLDPTDLDTHADILVAQPVGQVMAEVVRQLDAKKLGRSG